MEGTLLRSVVQMDVEAAGHGDNELVKVLVGVAAALRAAWNVVEIINAFEIKRDYTTALDDRKVSPVVVNNGQVQNPTGI